MHKLATNSVTVTNTYVLNRSNHNLSTSYRPSFSPIPSPNNGNALSNSILKDLCNTSKSNDQKKFNFNMETPTTKN